MDTQKKEKTLTVNARVTVCNTEMLSPVMFKLLKTNSYKPLSGRYRAIPALILETNTSAFLNSVEVICAFLKSLIQLF